MKSIPEHELIIPGQLDNLAKIDEFISQAAMQAGLDEEAVYAVQLAVDEACANIIQHAYGGEGRGEIRLSYQIQAEGLRIVIYDQGDTFDPDQVPKLDTNASLEERESGGMGLHFIKTLMDQVEFNFNTPQGNQLILFKRRGPTA